MAQLVTKKEKYGVSVAARIEPQLAHQIAAKAEKLGISMSQMLGMIITHGANPDRTIPIDNSEEIERLKSEVEAITHELSAAIDLYKRTAAEFISRISDDHTHTQELAAVYNQVLQENKDWNEG